MAKKYIKNYIYNLMLNGRSRVHENVHQIL